MMQIPVAASCSLFMLMLLVNRYINLCSAFSQHHDEAFSLKDDMQTHDMSKGAKAPKNEIQLSASHGKEANVFWENLNLTNEKHQHVQPIKWMLPHEHNNTQKNSVFSHDTSMLQESEMSAANKAKRGVGLLNELYPDFKKAYEYPSQVTQDYTPTLRQMQNRFCNLLWGKAQMLTGDKNSNALVNALSIGFSRCSSMKFKAAAAGETATWPECAAKVTGEISFFSWSREADAEKGECVLISMKSSSVTEMDVENCLRDAKEGEIAVSGVGPDDNCTSCVVSEWSQTPCTSWCEAGVSGRYRRIVEHASLEYCLKGNDKFCDKCPHLWETERCNANVKCGGAIQPGQHYCPKASKHSTKNVNSWKQCCEACFNSFTSSGGDTADPLTFSEASCFFYSFQNTTSTCELKSVVDCKNIHEPDPAWISGDVQTLPAANFSTVEWSSWAEWSSCEGIDVKQGWKKRKREVLTWGFRNDNADVKDKLSEVASCSESGSSVAPAAKMSGIQCGNRGHTANTTCCLLGDFVEWTEAQCEPVCGSDRYQIRKKRRLQNPVPNADGKLDPTCNLKNCQEEWEHAESRRCDNVPQCTSDCVYFDWTEWSACACAVPGAVAGIHARVRTAISGTLCPDMEEVEECRTVKCTEESSDLTYVYIAGGGAVALLLLGGIIAYRRINSREAREGWAYDTL